MRCAVICQLADGVHGVVAADVEEVTDVQLLQDGKQLLVHSFIGVPVRQFVAAAAQEAGRRALEQFDVEVVRQQGGQIHHALLQQACNTVAHAVYDIGTAALAALEHTGQTCVDNGSRTARLTNDCIFTHDDFSFVFFCFGFYSKIVQEARKQTRKGGQRLCPAARAEQDLQTDVARSTVDVNGGHFV